MTTTGASFFDTFKTEKESLSPFSPQVSTESNDSSTSSIRYKNITQQHHLDQALPDTPEPIKASNDMKRTRLSVYEDYLPEWQMLSESYKSQKQDLHKRIKNQLDDLQALEDRFDKLSADFHRKVENAYTQLADGLAEWQDDLDLEKSSLDREKEMMQHIRKTQDEKVKLNVGGQLFQTSLSTLRRDPNSTLAAMFDGHQCIKPDETDGSYFIDRDGTYFRLVLNYLRDLKVPSSIRDDPKIMDELMQEARHYQIKGLLKLGLTEDASRLFL